MVKEFGKKLNILVVWHEIPTLSHAWTFRVFHLLKRSQRYGLNITWISHDDAETSSKYRDELRGYCASVEILNKPNQPNKMRNRIIHTVKDMLISPELARDRIIPIHFYSKKMRRRIGELLLQNEFDMIYCSRPMLHYVLNANLPKVLEIEDPVLYPSYQIGRAHV